MTGTAEYKPANGTDEASSVDEDAVLKKVGYTPTLFRTLNAFQSFSFGFAEIEILGALFTYTYSFGIAIGGPATIMWSFIVGWVMALGISLCLAEIAALYPYAGGVYNWTAQLAPKDKSPLACYICGWANFIANAAGDAVIAFSFAQLFDAVVVGNGGKPVNEQQVAGIGILLLFLFNLVNLFRVDIVGMFTAFSSVAEIVAIILILITLLVKAPEYNTGHFVFSDYENFTGFSHKSYVVVIGMTAGLSVWSGYDAPAHMAEETTHAAATSSWAIFQTVLFSGLVGIPLLFVMLLCTTKADDDYMAGYFSVYGGSTANPAVNLLIQLCGENYGTGLCCLALCAVFASGVSSVSATARIFFAMTRDGAVPHSEFWSSINPVTKNPIHSIILIFVVDSLILLLCLSESGGLTAFYAILSIAILGFFVSYTIPIMTKLIYQPDIILKSSCSLGQFSNPLGWFVCIYMTYVMVISFLPLTHPVTVKNNNWLVVVASGFTFIFGLNWIFFARHTFKGPRVLLEGGAAPVPDMESAVELTSGENDSKEVVVASASSVEGSNAM